jgi:tetratricopeptide (TPR) repeat protein
VALRRYDAALESYDRALVLRPDFAEALSNRGAALQKLERFEEGLASVDRALALRPDYAEAHYNRGLTLHELARFEEAVESCDRALALALRPDYADALLNRGVALHQVRHGGQPPTSKTRHRGWPEAGPRILLASPGGGRGPFACSPDRDRVPTKRQEG